MALYSNHSVECSLSVYVWFRHYINASCINDLRVKYRVLAALRIIFQSSVIPHCLKVLFLCTIPTPNRAVVNHRYVAFKLYMAV